MMHCFKYFSLICFMFMGVSALADPVAPSSQCTIRDRNDTIVILVCAPGGNPESWRDAAQAACGSTLMCNAWIWDDPSKAPVKAPATDSDMPKGQAVAAIAIWVNDSNSLISLQRVR
ncbi:hypothetical protein SAMN05216404_1134 [Nitrosospira multiformis]|uniref:Uncharacterized protein n=1 Tax=Nitrosospira multiformis TaxID=1231 RepID=A0A1H8MJ63_9PROT|nr:hypothetical protein SAMN05216404_1134 [Nitrosospira multiformis]